MTQPGTRFSLEVNPRLPQRLARLQELANDLFYSWDRETRSLFARLNPALWESTGHSPKAFLKRIDEWRLTQAAEDNAYIGSYNRVLTEYDTYLARPHARGDALSDNDVIAYFCAEFGLHESFPIYSGGLGILAGDHCKAASDARLPFVGVGLLYRQGYFTQSIDGEGNQQAIYFDSDFEDLPVSPATDPAGREVHIKVEMPGRAVEVKVWVARVGHVRLYLLDTDLESNSEHDRFIAHRLYGGDRVMRIEQEIVLGLGGVRALEALGIRPRVWHINEGHAAFLVLERVRQLVKTGVAFSAAMEAVAVNTVFTTHTAVPAGHDHFADDMMLAYFGEYCRDVGLDAGDLLALGRTPQSADFNMTALAIRGSRHHNGVSRIHGGVSDRMLKDLWPQVPPEENPIDYVTNGVHVPTFLATEWGDLFERFVGVDWRERLTDQDYWKRVRTIPDHLFWSVRQYLKSQMLRLVRERTRDQHLRNGGSESHLDRLFRLTDPAHPGVLTIGFGRRFATYKRAALLFEDLDLLKRMVSDPLRPVVFLFAGKAHPADGPGQDLIRRITEVSRRPEFEGRVILVEGYDLRLARRLVSGVDVWLNNPIYPLEASGTSGMKAAINGVLNLSVLDGWWGEGYDGSNGWAIKPAAQGLDPQRRDREESRTLYELLQDQIIPLYYNERNGASFSAGWVAMAKQAIATLLPRFSATRMVNQYVAKFYMPAVRMGAQYHEHHCALAAEVAQWKARVRSAWSKVTIRRIDEPARRIAFGTSLRLEIGVNLDGLGPEDVTVELLLDPNPSEPQHPGVAALFFSPTDLRLPTGERIYALDLKPEFCGKLDYRIRAYPSHRMLTHPFELGLMTWI